VAVITGSSPLWRRVLLRVGIRHGRVLHRTNTPLILPDGRVRIHSSGHGADRVVVAVDDLGDVSIRPRRTIHGPIVEALEDLLGRDLAVVAEQCRIIEMIGEVIGDLFSRFG